MLAARCHYCSRLEQAMIRIADVGSADPIDWTPGDLQPKDRAAVLRSMDRCTKCGICQAYCPVAAVTDAFPGPKYVGPQAQRFRAIESLRETSPALCSGCGICTSVCPNGVAISDIITIAKAEMAKDGHHLTLGQRILNRPDLIGRLTCVAPRLANTILGSRILRTFGEYLFGIHRNAPLPRAHGPLFRRWLSQQQQPDGLEIAYFTGCAVEHYDPYVGIAAIRLLNTLGYRVTAPSHACCALPMLSSGEWGAACKKASRLAGDFARQVTTGRPIVTTSTSCSLTLREKYATYLSRHDATSRSLAGLVVDICEFLRDGHAEALAARLKPMAYRVLYHGPCQLRGHHVGQPAVELLRLVPDLEVTLSEATCCGVAGTYGYDHDKHEIAMAIGSSLFDQIRETHPDVVLCDSETCRWHIEKATSVPCRHPLEFLAAALSQDDPRLQRGRQFKETVTNLN